MDRPTADPAVAAPGPPDPADRAWVRHASLFLAGQTASLFGSSLVQYAILWHLTLTTQSGVVLMLATVAGFLPQAIVSVFGGVWADRHDRRLLIVGSDAVIAATTLALVVVLVSGVDDLWPVYVALAIRSIGAGIQTPAVGAFIPQIVPADKLMRVNGLNSSLQSGSMLLSPAVAAALYAAFGLQAVLLVDVVTAVIGIGLVALIRVGRHERADTSTGYFDDLRDGLGYVRGHPVVRRVLVVFALVFFLAVPPSYLTPLLIVRDFGPEVWKLTVNELAFSVGMVLGGALLAWWGGLSDRVLMLSVATVVFGGLTVGLGLAPVLWLFFALMFLVGLCVPFFWTTANTLLQETVEPDFLGRVFGVLGIVMSLAMPVGMLVFGPLADVVPLDMLLIAGGAVTVLVGIVVLAHPPVDRHASKPA